MDRFLIAIFGWTKSISEKVRRMYGRMDGQDQQNASMKFRLMVGNDENGWMGFLYLVH